MNYYLSQATSVPDPTLLNRFHYDFVGGKLVCIWSNTVIMWTLIKRFSVQHRISDRTDEIHGSRCQNVLYIYNLTCAVSTALRRIGGLANILHYFDNDYRKRIVLNDIESTTATTNYYLTSQCYR